MDRDVTQGQPVEQAQPPAAGPGDRWYADHGEVVGFARVLVDAGTLDSPNDVIYFSAVEMGTGIRNLDLQRPPYRTHPRMGGLR